MPQIFAKMLIGLPVETEVGLHVGKIADIGLDVDTHTVKKYYVTSGNMVQQLLKDSGTLTIDPSQVVAITAEKMIVTDLVDREIAAAAQPAT